MDKTPLIGPAWLRLILFIICLIALGLIFSLAATYLPFEKPEPGGYSPVTLINVLVSVFVSLLTVFLFVKFIDRKKVASLGLQLKNNGNFAATGFFTALFMLGIGTLLLVLNKNLVFTNIEFDAGNLYVGLGLMIFVAVAEELVFRGYILNTLLSFSNKWLALGISALIFAALHGANPGINPLPMINVFLAGLVLGINYIYTRNLWFGMMLHFAWNFFQGPVLGFNVSGLSLQGILDQQLTGSQTLTGGQFGFEGSLIESVILLLTFASLAWIYEKKFNGFTKRLATKPTTVRA